MTHVNHIYPVSEAVKRTLDDPQMEMNLPVLHRTWSNAIVVDIVEDPHLGQPMQKLARCAHGRFPVLNLDTGETMYLYVRVIRTPPTDLRPPMREDIVANDLKKIVYTILAEYNAKYHGVRPRIGFEDANNVQQFVSFCMSIAFLPKAWNAEDYALSKRLGYALLEDDAGVPKIISPIYDQIVRGVGPYDGKTEEAKLEKSYGTLYVPLHANRVRFRTIPSKFFTRRPMFLGSSRIRNEKAGKPVFDGTPEEVEAYAKRNGYAYRDGLAFRNGLPVTGELELFGTRQRFAFDHVDPSIDVSKLVTPQGLREALQENLPLYFPFLQEFGLMGALKFDNAQ